MLSYLLIGGIVLLLAWVGWLVWQRSRTARPGLARAVPVPTAVPDLADESVQASQLPESGWLALAREKMAAGEWRLALRALYLARLSRLAADGLVSLARFKTNRDYEEELGRRARQRRELVEAFGAQRRQFEEVWYGDHPAEPDVAQAWLAEFEPRPAA